MSNNNPQKLVVDAFVSELSKMMQDLEEGKIPTISPKLKTMMEKVSTVVPKAKSMTETEIEQWTEETLKEIELPKEK